MKKIIILLLTIILMPAIAGLYGALHDQLSYTISPEYFTKFKFYQFGLADIGNEAILPQPRLAAAVVGVMATWWTGIPIGVALGIFGLFYKSNTMLRAIITGVIITLGIAVLTGLTGLIYGWFFLGNSHPPGWLFYSNISPVVTSQLPAWISSSSWSSSQPQ